MEKTTTQIDKKLRKKLIQLKYELKLKSINDVLLVLINTNSIHNLRTK